MESAPVPPSIRSSPPRALIVSSLPSPLIVSASAVPLSVFLPPLPVMIAVVEYLSLTLSVPARHAWHAVGASWARRRALHPCRRPSAESGRRYFIPNPDHIIHRSKIYALAPRRGNSPKH